MAKRPPLPSVPPRWRKSGRLGSLSRRVRVEAAKSAATILAVHKTGMGDVQAEWKAAIDSGGALLAAMEPASRRGANVVPAADQADRSPGLLPKGCDLASEDRQAANASDVPITADPADGLSAGFSEPGGAAPADLRTTDRSGKPITAEQADGLSGHFFDAEGVAPDDEQSAYPSDVQRAGQADRLSGYSSEALEDMPAADMSDTQTAAVQADKVFGFFSGMHGSASADKTTAVLSDVPPDEQADRVSGHLAEAPRAALANTKTADVVGAEGGASIDEQTADLYGAKTAALMDLPTTDLAGLLTVDVPGNSDVLRAPAGYDDTPAAGSRPISYRIDGTEVSGAECRLLDKDWSFLRHDAQKPPEGDWRTWLLMGGRGSGKTRAGAEWVHALATKQKPRSDLRIALVAETLGDAREVMIDGVSGICRIARKDRPEFEASRRRLVWPNGAMAQIFSSEDPESLRGPQFHHAWCDELGKWKHATETWDMLQFGLRLGDRPRVLVTTTPRPLPILKRLIAETGTVTARISTAQNANNLAPGFISAMAERYGGTRLGRQELDGELIADREDGLWKRGMIEALTVRQTGPLSRIVVAVDPPAAATARGSCCGIVVAGLDASGRAVVLADASVEGASPAGWANAVLRAYRRFDADRIVAEINQGGDMVTAVLRSVEAQIPISTVRATRGKWLRAEPVAALYEQGRVIHAHRFAELEDQMCDFGPDGLSAGRSPDRLDALVWALTALMLDRNGEPRVRGI